MKNILLVIICSFFFITCSSTGPSSSTTGTATADVETGSVDIGVDESFTVTFSAAVNAATVST